MKLFVFFLFLIFSLEIQLRSKKLEICSLNKKFTKIQQFSLLDKNQKTYLKV